MTFSLLATESLYGNQSIIEATNTQQIKEILSDLPKGTVIFIDVDDTLITPLSKIFRANSPYRFIITELKNNRDKFPDFEAILSHWRLKRKTQLVSKEWPEIIRSLKEKHLIFALTKMDTGPIGTIPSMEKWRYNELTQKGIVFTYLLGGMPEKVLLQNASSSPATFYYGIFGTGTYTKGEVVHAFLGIQNAPHIIFIDDNKDQLLDVQAACQEEKVSFLGIHFKGLELLPGEPNPKAAELQKEYLLTNGLWLEDEEAEKMCNIQNHLAAE